ncbi:MAG: tetratricopeptide repeat protein, partial [Myxococcales bacterium]|nr:tetratricopeptide repeat protein [Myxococcales bacterium]
ASELDRRAYDLASRVHGPDHPITMLALGNLASDDMALGDFEAARAGYARACDLREVALGPDHPDLARSFSNLAATEVELGLLDEAREHVTRAIEIYETRLGAHHVTLASFLTLRGEIELRSHHESAARPYLERALALQATEPLPSDERAATRWGLARALWPEPRERARARSLARDAAALYREHPEKTPRDLAAVDAWLIANDR